MVGLILMAGLIGLGVWLKAPRGLVAGTVTLIWAGLVLAHLVAPGSGLAQALGGSAPGWIGLGVTAVLVLVYREGLRRLRARAIAPVVPPPLPGALLPAELERYARHIFLREIGGTGQKRLKAARVLVVGAGGLGSPVLLYLAAAGVGTLGVVDDDSVSASNLQRQVIHRDADLGLPKVFSAERAILALNPYVTVRPYNRRLDAQTAAALAAEYDLVVDCSDNFETRYTLNAATVAAGKPLLSGAIAQWEGQVSIYHPAQGAPCYACLFPQAPAPGLAPSCAEAGVVGALPGIIGSIMAAEAIKLITGAGAPARGRLILHDALWGENRQIAVAPRAECAVCGGQPGAGLDSGSAPA